MASLGNEPFLVCSRVMVYKIVGARWWDRVRTNDRRTLEGLITFDFRIVWTFASRWLDVVCRVRAILCVRDASLQCPTRDVLLPSLVAEKRACSKYSTRQSATEKYTKCCESTMVYYIVGRLTTSLICRRTCRAIDSSYRQIQRRRDKEKKMENEKGTWIEEVEIEFTLSKLRVKEAESEKLGNCTTGRWWWYQRLIIESPASRTKDLEENRWYSTIHNTQRNGRDSG